METNPSRYFRFCDERHGEPETMAMRRKPLTEEQIDRRIAFLIAEAKSANPIRDQAITFALRVITNCFSVNDDMGSAAIKERLRYRSEKAHALAETMPFKQWITQVQNEHPYPLRRAWEWLCRERQTVTTEGVRLHLSRWPMVVVTKEEHGRLVDRDEQTPEERYGAANIEVWEQDADGQWGPSADFWQR